MIARAITHAAVLLNLLMVGLGSFGTAAQPAYGGPAASTPANPQAAPTAPAIMDPAVVDLISKYADFFREQAESSQTLAKEHREFLEFVYTVVAAILAGTVFLAGALMAFLHFHTVRSIRKEVTRRFHERVDKEIEAKICAFRKQIDEIGNEAERTWPTRSRPTS